MSSSEYIFKGADFVGDFESLYRGDQNPWNQLDAGPENESRRALAVSLCKRYQMSSRSTVTVELGCGFGLLTSALADHGFISHGVDISETAIKFAKEMNNSGTYHNFDVVEFENIISLAPDILLMSEISWYILPHLRKFILNLKEYASDRRESIYLFHSLTTYAPGIQKYGLNYFSNLNEILDFFSLDYLEFGSIVDCKQKNTTGTYFFAEITPS